MNPLEQIGTERLTLRKPHEENTPEIYLAYAQDQVVTRYLTWRPHKNVQETYQMVRTHAGVLG